MKTIRFFFLILVLSSCQKDLLNKYPLDSPSSSTFFSNETELTLAINSAYRGLYWLSNANVPYQLYIEGATDLVFIRGNGANMITVQSGQFSTETGVFYSAWSNFYESIARCNNILENMHRAVDNVSEEFYNRIEAEAKFLRAYNYTYLVNLYGDVPFVTSMLSLEEGQMAKTDKSIIIEQLFEDLDFAASALPVAWEAAEDGRITKGAALGLKARLALWTGHYDIAASAAESVIDLGNYEIYPNYENLFKHEGEGSHESILHIPFLIGVAASGTPREIGPRTGSGYSIIVPTQTLVDMYQCTDGKRVDESDVFNPNDQFANRDPRLFQSILYPGQWFNGYLFETNPSARTTQRDVNGVISWVNNLEVTNAYGTFTGYLWKKYLDEKDVPNDVLRSELNFMLMRYAEVLLTYAEAQIELGDVTPKVIDAINAVRRRPSVMMPAASISMTIDELRDLVRYERTIELAGEGFRLFDIRRWRIAEHVLPGNLLGKRRSTSWDLPVTPSFNVYGKPIYENETTIFQIISNNVFDASKHYLWPIPQRELDRNRMLTQNENY